MTAIQLISERWLKNAKAELSCYATGPNKDAKIAEIADAQKHFDARCEVEALAKNQDFRTNDYQGVCKITGQAVKPSCGFVRKENGKWTTYSFAAVQEIVGYVFEG